MRTLQMTFDDDLVTELDQVVQESHTNRSAFTREALRMAIALYHRRKLIEKQRAGYLRHPVTPGEFSVWEDEQACSTLEDGMPRDCAINFDHIQTVQKAKLGALITTLSAQKLAEVEQAVSFALGLNGFEEYW